MEKLYQAAEGPEHWQKDIRFERTKDFRCPKKGEWYLSGAILEAWKAPSDLSMQFWILKRVAVRLVPAYYEKI